MAGGYATPGKSAPRAAAKPAAAKPAARSPLPTAIASPLGLPALPLALQRKLEVGPSGDRFEHEADRVASQVTSSPVPSAGPPPAISPLGAGAPSGRRQARRAEEKPVSLREKKPEDETADIGEVAKALQGKALQRKTEKPLDPVDKPVEKDKLGQAKMETGRIQRDDVDDDTIAESALAQTKPLDGVAQRAVVPAEASLVETGPKEEEKKPEEPVPAQAKPAQRDGPGGAFTAPSSVEAGVGALSGRGSPLPADVRGYMEPRFGRDFSNVRVHTGGEAAGLSHAVGARAFTVGNDVFFGAGQYRPDTQAGRQLMAHELTHTVQQHGGSAQAQPYRIQREGAQQASTTTPPAAEPPSATEPPSKVFTNRIGTIDASNDQAKTITINGLPIPQLEGAPKGANSLAPGVPEGSNPRIPASPGLDFAYPGKTPRGSTTARQQWLARARTDYAGSLAAAIPQRTHAPRKQAKADAADQPTIGGQPAVYLKPLGTKTDSANFIIFGTAGSLAGSDEILLPIWNEKKQNALFDVDHIQELQLGGKDGWDNFWLLDQSTNRSAGSNISREMKTSYSELIEAARAAGFWTADRGGDTPPTFNNFKNKEPANNYSLHFKGLRNIPVSGTKAYWTREMIGAGDHLGFLEQLSPGDIAEQGLVGPPAEKPSHISIFAQPRFGGFRRRLRISRNPPDLHDSISANPEFKDQLFKGFRVTSVRSELAPEAPLTPNTPIYTFEGESFNKSGIIQGGRTLISTYWSPEFGYSGFINDGFLKERMGALSITGASPIEIQEAGVTADGAMFARGEIVATKALFPNLRIPIYFQGHDIFIAFPIPTESLHFGPLSVTEAELQVGVGEHGVFVGGFANVAIDQVGSGRVEGRVERGGPIITGTFNFDLDFLNPAQASMTYRMADDSLTLTLTAGVQDGRLPGVESGTVTATISSESIAVDGTLNLKTPLQGTQLTIVYSPETGLAIGANDIPLPFTRLPGVKDARASILARRDPETGEWRVSGMGAATIDVPPAQGTLMIAINGQAVTITGGASFTQGPASGSINFTATNQAVDVEGNPIEGEAGEGFTVSGRGSASLQFGILKGTATVELTPDAHIIVTGEIALPPTQEVFAKQAYEKTLLHVEPPEFPIWGVSVAGYGIGIFAFIDAYLKFDAFVGPGTLQNTAVQVTFDFDKPEDAVIDGHAEFVVPAGAGFTLDIGGGLRARVAIASLEGRVGLDARLGLLAEARAGVDLHWSQAEGLSLAAVAEAHARPQFDIGVNASVKASVDLLLTEVSHTWGPWRKQLGSFGPGLDVGVKVPIGWSETNGLDFDTSKIEITKPDIDFGAVMKDAFLSLV